jgi:hypothetical protein
MLANREGGLESEWKLRDPAMIGQSLAFSRPRPETFIDVTRQTCKLCPSSGGEGDAIV